MALAIITAHAGADSLRDAVKSWTDFDIGECSVEGKYWHDYLRWVNPPDPEGRWETIRYSIPAAEPNVYIVDGTEGMLAAYEKGLAIARRCHDDVIAFFHDDLIIQDENWLPRVMREFEAPDVGVVGFCGALVHGSPELYKRPYDYRQLIRSHVLSNMEDAEVHGERFKGSNDAATLDGFALIARRSLLESAGGWPLGKLDYIMYDQWLVCMAHRLGYRVRVVGVACHHLGGRTAVALKRNDDDSGEKYQAAHRYIYDEFRDVLPWSVI